jgi:single-strand DNA-binding protein
MPAEAGSPRRARRPSSADTTARRPCRRATGLVGAAAGRKGRRTVNRVLITGRLTRDPELRVLASGKSVCQFSVATNEYAGNGKEKAEFHSIVAWEKLADICGRYLGKGQQVAVEGRIQTRTWDDDRGQRHWKTEIVAVQVELLSGRRKKDYDAEQAAEAIVAQAAKLGDQPIDAAADADAVTESEEDEEATAEAAA